MTTVNDPTCTYCVNAAKEALLSYSDRFTRYDEVGTPNTGGWPSWLSNDTIVIGSGSSTQYYYKLGMPEAAEWFADSDFVTQNFQTLIDAEGAPSGDRLAVVRGNNQETILLLKMNGPPPNKPTIANSSCAALTVTETRRCAASAPVDPDPASSKSELLQRRFVERYRTWDRPALAPPRLATAARSSPPSHPPAAHSRSTKRRRVHSLDAPAARARASSRSDLDRLDERPPGGRNLLVARSRDPEPAAGAQHESQRNPTTPRVIIRLPT